ncbi:MAG: UDP-2,3-diacylglucosamine hydrolase [Bacteroidia bacterium]|nr:UDP-2,3-diacylglucosamine hydrolase [Bacteroidia bacterium]
MTATAKKIYFASDFHLGVPDADSSLKREKLLVRWLEEIKNDAAEIYLVGDLFDFWFEYDTAVPRGFTRFLGKLAELSDSGIPIHIFTGNHDMWMFGYLEKELNVTLHREPIVREYAGKKFFIGHGDGLGPGDHGFKMIKKVFANKASQWMFAKLHPDWGIKIAQYWSGKSRDNNEDEKYLGEDGEWLVQFAKEKLRTEHFDYFIFGHRHLPLYMNVGTDSYYINLGDWISHNTYAVFDGEHLGLIKYVE